MGQPITWRNVSTPTFGGAGRLMQGAQQSLNSGLNTLQQLAQQQGDTQAENWNTQKDNNTTDLLARIQATSDLGAHDKLSAEINPEALQSTYGRQVDSLKVLAAMNKQDDTIRSEALVKDEYGQKMADASERDMVGWIEQLTNAGKYKEAQALTEQVGGLRTLTRANLTQGIDDAQHTDTKRDQDAWRFNRDRGEYAHTQKNRRDKENFQALVQDAYDQGYGPLATREYIKEQAKGKYQGEMFNYLMGFDKHYESMRGLTSDQRERIAEQEVQVDQKYAPSINHYTQRKAAAEQELAHLGTVTPKGEKRWDVGDLITHVRKNYKLQDDPDLTFNDGSLQSLPQDAKAITTVMRQLSKRYGMGNSAPDMRLAAKVFERLNYYDVDDGRIEFDTAVITDKVKEVLYEEQQRRNTYASKKEDVRMYTDALKKLQQGQDSEKRNASKYERGAVVRRLKQDK